jgi:glutamyl/glutaminyl-tRNA synthetase
MISRIAPTPSGFLHLGNVFSFLLTEKLVQESKGQLMLRIDDLDAERKRPEYIHDIFETIHWLKIQIDIGPQSPGDFEKNWSQHLRLELYEKAIQKLLDEKKVFACTCSRKDISFGKNCNCELKNLADESPDSALRIKLPIDLTNHFVKMNGVEHKLPEHEFVIRKKDKLPAYQLSSVIDDLHFGVTHIVRGNDLHESSLMQLYLTNEIGGNKFAETHFTHHALLSDKDGLKLSKSAGAMSIKTMRENGVTAYQIRDQFEKWFQTAFD